MNLARFVPRLPLLILFMVITTSCGQQSPSPDGIQHLTEIPIGSAASPTRIATLVTAIPTQTFTPTLSPSRIEQEISRFYSDNGGCELPCFWGILPGKTTVEEIRSQFSLLGELSDDTRSKDKINNQEVTLITVQTPTEIDKFQEENWTFWVVTQNNVVKGITARSTYIHNTSIPTISNMLSIFGKPEEIWIAVMPYFLDYDKETSYKIALFYPSKGILVMGSGIAPILSEKGGVVKFSICPQKIAETIDMKEYFPFSFHLWSPEVKWSFTDITDIQLFGHEFYSPLDSYGNIITSEEFFEIYMDAATTQCFEITQ